MESKKMPKNSLFWLGLLVMAIALYFVKDEAGIDSIPDFLLYTAVGTVACFVVATIAAALGGVVAEKFYGEKSEITNNAVIACFLLAVVALVLISRSDSYTPEKVAERLSLGEVLEAYDEKDWDQTYDSVFHYIKENAREDYSDTELMEKIGIDVSDFVYEYLDNHR